MSRYSGAVSVASAMMTGHAPDRWFTERSRRVRMTNQSKKLRGTNLELAQRCRERLNGDRSDDNRRDDQ